ncbi:hypothetical protein AB5N19_07040 [Seiridium cardinale]
MWNCRDGQQGLTACRAVSFFATFILVFLLGYGHSFPLNSDEDLGFIIAGALKLDSVELAVHDIHNRSEIHAALQARVLGGNINNPTWAQRQQTGRRMFCFIIQPLLFLLWCLMKGVNAAQSQFVFDDLASYGWEILDMGDEAAKDEYRDHINDLYTGFGFNRANDDGWGAVHMSEWPEDAVDQHEPTMGQYQVISNGAEGYIVACNSYSPQERVNDAGEGTVPNLAKWSDTVPLVWQNKHAGATLNYVVRAYIANINTRKIMYEALVATGHTTLPAWPGADITITNADDPNAAAFWGLLGSYHAAAPAYMLAQHKGIFGQKTINHIRIWSEDTDWPVSSAQADLEEMLPNMLLYVEDAPAQDA